MVSELVLFQLSSFCALIGMTLGWRGVMTKFAGFYDLPTAWSQVFWGIVLGGVYAVMADGLLFQPYFITVESEAKRVCGTQRVLPALRRTRCFGVFPSASATPPRSKGRLPTFEWVGARSCDWRDDRHGRDVPYV